MKDNLDELNALRAAILENAGFAIIAGNLQGVITLFNRAAEEMLGYSADEMLGKLTPSVFHLEDEVVKKAEEFSKELGVDVEPGFDVFVIKTRMGLENKHEWTYVRKDGSHVPVLLTVTAIRNSKNIITGYLGVAAEITDLKIAQQQVVASNKRLNEAQKLAKVGSWELDLITNSLWWSDETFRLFEVDPNQFGASYEAFLDAIHPEDRGLVDQAYTDSLKNRQPYEITHRLLFSDGRVKFVNEACETLYDVDGKPVLSRGTVQDITERVKFTERLEKTVEERTMELSYDKARFSAVIETAADGIIITDNRGIITQFNQSASKLFGYTEEEAIGNNVSILMPEAYAKNHDASVSRHIETQENRIIGSGRELQGRRKDGSIFPIYIALSKIETNHQCSGFTAIVHDLTSEHEKAKELTQAKEAAEQANKAKSQFLAIMSHEIRTPMNAILGYSELELVNKTLPDKSLQNLHKIHDSSQFLLNIINDILDLSKLESEKVKLENIPFQLNEFIQETLTVFEQQIQAKGLSLSVNLAPELPSCISGDPTRLRQIITNLLSNAIKFTEQGQITFECITDKSPNTLHFSVGDTGIGLSNEQIEKIFDSFAQADASTTRIYGGTGLGTSISKRLVEAMGGEIWVESEQGKGSIFHFTCNLALVDDCIQKGRVGEKDFQIINSDQDVKESTPGSADILLVEDNQFNQELILQQLEICGYSADIAEHGADALNKIENGNYRLVISDISMPIMDGYELIRQIRNQETGTQKYLKVMAMTANVMDGENQKCIEKGFDDYCAKPLQIDILRKKLLRLL